MEPPGVNEFITFTLPVQLSLVIPRLFLLDTLVRLTVIREDPISRTVTFFNFWQLF